MKTKKQTQNHEVTTGTPAQLLYSADFKDTIQRISELHFDKLHKLFDN